MPFASTPLRVVVALACAACAQAAVTDTLAAARLPAGGRLPPSDWQQPQTDGAHAAARVQPAAAASDGSLLASALPPLRLVFAHMMLCFAAFSPPGNSSAAVAGYMQEIAIARAAGLDGLATEYLGKDAYYAPAAQGMWEACAASNAASPSSPPFQLLIIINFCCELNLTDAVNLYVAYHNHSCALQIDGRPVFSSWSAVDWRAGGAAEQARWERDFFGPIAALGLPRPFFFPFIYAFDAATGTYEETATLAEQQATLSTFSEILDGLWYWGCAPPGDAVATSSLATVQACTAAGKRSAVPVSGPYSPHIGDRTAGGGNNRYTQGNGGRAIQQAWQTHISSAADLVIATTWNDLGEHHFIGPYNKTLWGNDYMTGWDAGNGPNLFPHQAYLDLSAYYIAWFKLPMGSPAPPVSPADELFVFFYNLQPINNTCPGDPIGPLTKITDDPDYPLEDAIFVTTLLASPANITIISGDNPPRTFAVAAGLTDVEAPAAPGVQRFILTRLGSELVNVVGSESINTTAQAANICNMQTFSGTARVPTL